jgi:hypothetical protein
MPDSQSPAEPTANDAVEDQSGENRLVENQWGECEQGAPKNGRDNRAEYGGPKGREPTRYGDWEKNGRCIDF